MNILFINSGYPTPEVGGVERVTSDLGQWLISRGYVVYCLVLCGDIPEKSSFPFHCVKLPEGDGWGTEANMRAFRAIQKENGIDVIIVQSERAQAVELCSRDGILPGVKLLTVLHTSPVTQRGHFWADCIAPQLMQYGLWHTILRFPQLCAGYFMNHRGEYQWELQKLRTMYGISDRYVTLSRTFHKELVHWGKLPDGGKKLAAIPNPLSMASADIDPSQKEKILLWMGRVVFPQKKTDRIIRIWEKLSVRYTDWRLCIVGDGEARPILEKYCQRKHIPNVVFAGRQPSEPWYRRAPILCMTSSWEGWGLVLTEAMNFGCVPVAYESYSSLRDIITDGKDGFCIPAFDEGEYIRKLSRLMDDANLRARMARCGQESVNYFRMENVGKMWEKLLNEVTRTDE